MNNKDPKAHIADTCSNLAIQKLNQTKRYSLIATAMLEKIMADRSLISSAAKLWQFLYSQATINEELKITLSYSMLATKFSCSERTIQRHVKNLNEKGYLIVKNNFYHTGQKANTFYIRFPQNHIEEIEKTANRKINIEGEELNKTTYLNPMCKEDNFVTPRHDKTVLPYNEVININKNTNNNVVVSSIPSKMVTQKNINFNSCQTYSQNLQELDQQLACIQRLEQELLQLQDQQLQTLSQMESYDLLRRIGEISAAISHENHVLEQLKKQIANTVTKQERQQKLTESMDFMNQQPGNRQISSFALKRLQKTIQDIVTSDIKIQNQLMNEVIYEIRFGSLVCSNKTKEELPTDHAINIALKLIRENRWFTPTTLKNSDDDYYQCSEDKQIVSRRTFFKSDIKVA